MAGQPPARFGSITLTRAPLSTIVHLTGDIDAGLRGPAGEALAEAVHRHLPVVLETTGVTFIDSTGTAFLIQCATFARQEGLSVTLPDPPEAVASVLHLVGAEWLFDKR